MCVFFCPTVVVLCCVDVLSSNIITVQECGGRGARSNMTAVSKLYPARVGWAFNLFRTLQFDRTYVVESYANSHVFFQIPGFLQGALPISRIALFLLR